MPYDRFLEHYPRNGLQREGICGLMELGWRSNGPALLWSRSVAWPKSFLYFGREATFGFTSGRASVVHQTDFPAFARTISQPLPPA